MHNTACIIRLTYSVTASGGETETMMLRTSQQQALRAAPHRRELARGSVLSKHPSENGFRSEGFKQKKTSGGARWEKPGAEQASKKVVPTSIIVDDCYVLQTKHPGIWVHGTTPIHWCPVLRSHAGLFFWCFVDYLNKRTMIFSFWAEGILFLVIMYSSGRKHALGRTPYLPNHIFYASAVCVRRKLTFTAIFLVLLTDQFDAFFNPENASETSTTNNTPPTWKTYELSRHRRCITLKLGDMPTTPIPTDVSL